MTLSALIKKGGLSGSMTATPATPATQEADKPVTVAPVATVAVAELPELLTELSPDEQSNIRSRLAHIEETDSAIIAEVVNKCRNDRGARRYFLKRSEEVPKQVTFNHPNTCGGCIHFKRIDHQHLGHRAIRGTGSHRRIVGHGPAISRTLFTKAPANPQRPAKARKGRNKKVNFPNDFG